MSLQQTIALQRRWAKVSKKKRAAIASELGKKSAEKKKKSGKMKAHIKLMVKSRKNVKN